MAGTTPRLGIYQMGGGLSGAYGATEQVNVDKINEGFIKVDAAVGVFICTSTTRPATPFGGQEIYETNTKNSLYWSTALVRWVPLGIPNASSDALRNALFPVPATSDRVYRTDKGEGEQMEFYSGTAWDVPYYPFRMAAGTASWTTSATAGQLLSQVAVTFPVGRFTITPIIEVSLNTGVGGTGKFVPRVLSPLAANFQATVYHGDGTALPVSTSVAVNWTAFQMSRGSASG